MSAISTAERGYLSSVSTTRSEKRAEYEVISRITHRLRDAARQSKKDYPSYIACLNENRKLWQVMALNVTEDENRLPNELKASIFYLYQFTEAHTKKILSNNVSVMPLLEVNMAVMRGLKSEGAQK